jgi:hypothetical protein
MSDDKAPQTTIALDGPTLEYCRGLEEQIRAEYKDYVPRRSFIGEIAHSVAVAMALAVFAFCGYWILRIGWAAAAALWR